MLVEYWKRADYNIFYSLSEQKKKTVKMLQKSERWTLEYMNNARKQLGWFSRKYFSVFKNDFEVSKLFRVIDGSYVKWYIQTIKRTEKEQDFDEKRFVLLFILPQTLVRIDLIWDFTFPFVLAVRCPKKFVCNFVVKYIPLFRTPDVM